MKSCRTASIVSAVPVVLASAFAACHDDKKPNVPPVTTARPTEPDPMPTPMPVAASPFTGPPGTAVEARGLAPPQPPVDPPAKASFVEPPSKIVDGLCVTVLFAVARGKMTVMDETLAEGDVLVVHHALDAEVKGAGLAVEARMRMNDCVVPARPAPQKTVVRSTQAQKLEWGGGSGQAQKMSAWLDVGPKVSPNLYLGRLEGTAAVAEHVHATSWEIVATIEAKGTVTVDGKEQRRSITNSAVATHGAL